MATGRDASPNRKRPVRGTGPSAFDTAKLRTDMRLYGTVLVFMAAVGAVSARAETVDLGKVFEARVYFADDSLMCA